jgi:hypothetical protein
VSTVGPGSPASPFAGSPGAAVWLWLTVRHGDGP